VDRPPQQVQVPAGLRQLTIRQRHTGTEDIGQPINQILIGPIPVPSAVVEDLVSDPPTNTNRFALSSLSTPRGGNQGIPQRRVRLLPTSFGNHDRAASIVKLDRLDRINTTDLK